MTKLETAQAISSLTKTYTELFNFISEEDKELFIVVIRNLLKSIK